ncbi:hypothetical protein BDV93DRAFT_601369 [Ceratobasidium sp. AG-I]|nr:hypothetical protein BDV93DRAFT_601369 [Ceratobasidium sp. AG-I]
MPYALGDGLVERRYRVDWDVERAKRQDPEPSSGETSGAPEPTEASTAEPETSTAPPTSSAAEPTTSAPPSTTPTSAAAPTSNSPSQTATLPTASATSAPTPTPTSPAESSAAVSQSSASSASTRSAANSLSSAGSSPVATQIYTSFITTNAAGQSIVTISITSTYAVPTSAPSSKSSTNTGAIVGGVVGGVGGLLLLVAVLWFIRRKTKKDQFEDNMFAPDRNVNREELDLAGDNVDDPEAVATPYHLPPSPTRNEMAMAAGVRPLSAHSHSAVSTGRPLSGAYDEAAGPGSRPTSGQSYYTQPGGGMTMPVPMRMSLDHIAYTQSRGNSTLDHHNTTSATSEGLSDTSSSARLMKDREARRMHVANADHGGVVVHSDGGRVNEVEEGPQEIPPTYDSIGGPSGPPGPR